MRLLTRSDFDGLVCAALLVEKGVVNEIEFVHPRDIQAGKVDVTSNDVLANIPHAPACGLWFDHHTSEEERIELGNITFEGDCRAAPSAAQVIWDYYGGEDTFGSHFLELMEAVNKVDSADLTVEEIILAESWIQIAFIIDPRTGLERMGNFRISNEQFFRDMIEYCRTKTIEEILDIDDVKERVNAYNEQQIQFKEMLRRCVTVDRNVVTTNLLNEETIYCGNRFIVFASHPDQNIEIRIEPDQDNVNLSCGHSIVNRSSKTNVGKLMSEFGGGGHRQVGSCRVPRDQWEDVYNKIKAQMLNDG